MDTDVQLHNGVNSFSVIGDGRNLAGLLEIASTESQRYGRPIERIESSDTNVEGHVEINFVFAAQTNDQHTAEPADHQPREDPVIHLYPLSDEHGDATISANSAALRMLRDAIEGLLEDHGPLKSAGEVRVFASDGEAYDLSIEKREGAPHAALWELLPEPYFVPRGRAREAGMDV